MKTNRRSFLRMTGALGAGAFAFGDNSIELVAQASRALGTRTADDVAADESYWRDIQNAFTLDRSLINLNNGNSCPSPTVVHEGRRPFGEKRGDRRPAQPSCTRPTSAISITRTRRRCITAG